MSKEWSNLAKIVYKRTYARRKENSELETWNETAERVVAGNIKGKNVPESEIKRLLWFMKNRKALPGGRGLWCSGTQTHERLGAGALINCWFFTLDNWENFVLTQDLLMLGGGVGASVEHKYTSKLPKVKKGVKIYHKGTKDADFIVPDSREGWCELLRRTLESFFVTGRGFSFSTVCVRGAGEIISGFGGTSSGPLPLITFIEKICKILRNREGRSVHPIDVGDIIAATGEMVVSGNIRRSAIILLGDSWDKEYLKAKRWDLGDIPTFRAYANYSVICEDIEDLHPLFWKTYEHGEPFGIVNRKNIQKYGRMGELQADSAIGVNPCGESTLETGESCNLQEIPLMNLDSVEEFEEAAVLLHRYGKRVTMDGLHHQVCDNVLKRNRRIGTGITGCLGSPLFTPEILDKVYARIQEENILSSKELNIPPAIRTTVIKPSGTMSKLTDMEGCEGIHGPYSEYIIQRVRFSSNDPLIPLLKQAGHHIEPVIKFDGHYDHTTSVVDFYVKAPEGIPIAGKDLDTWKQLEVLKMAQKHWSDQSVSVTVYYKREEIPQVKEWLANNLDSIKTISFLCHSDHGFKQAPKEPITEEQYNKLSSKIKQIEFEEITEGKVMEGLECAGGVCPLR